MQMFHALVFTCRALIKMVNGLVFNVVHHQRADGCAHGKIAVALLL